MSLSTASNKSACITFALLALTTSSAFASASASSLVQECNDCSSSSSSSAIFESSTIIHKRPIPIHLPPLSTIIDNGESVVDGTVNASQRNASVYFDDSNSNDDESESDHMEYDYAFEEQPVEFQLPAELASLIATAAKYTSSPSIEEKSSSSSPAAAPSLLGQVQVRYYATHHSGNTDTELCSSKSASEFELWEESYESLRECCEVNFGWKFDSCVGIL